MTLFLRHGGVQRIALIISTLLIAGCGTPAPAPQATPPTAAPTAAAAGTSAPVSNVANWPTRAADIALYKGADRQAMLEAGAKTEGKVVWYGTSNIENLKAVAEAFQAKYPYLTVDYVNVSGSGMASRVIQESQAGSTQADVVSSGDLSAITAAGVMMKFYSPSADANLPARFVNPDGMRDAIQDNQYAFVYNTNLVPADKVPRKYADLLDSFWQGKILTEGPFDAKFELGIVKMMGQDQGQSFLDGFVPISVLHEGASANVNSVISGERPAAFGVLAYLPESLAATQGAPIKTVLFTPTITYPQWAGPTTNTPHPHAAMLFLDYVVGREGAQAWSDSQGNYSARTDVVYKQPWLAALKQRVDSLQTFQLDDTTFGNDLAAVQKRMQQAYGLQ